MNSMFFAPTRSIPIDTLNEQYQLANSHFIDVDGLNVHIRDVPCTANPDAPVLLCLHGIFASLHTWDKWTERLKDRFRIISIDVPNFGLTGQFPDNKRITKDTYPDFFNSLLDALEIDSCHMAGNSLGGFFTYSFAAKYPERVKKMILLDSAGFFFIPPMPLVGWGAPLGSYVAENTNPPKTLVYQLLRQAYADGSRASKEELRRYYDLMLRPGNRSGATKIMHFVRNNFGFDTRCLKDIPVPALIMWGEHDHWIPTRHAEKFHQALPNSELIYYADCGHMPMEEKPDQSSEDAAKFLLLD